jgi:pimeloyl-ACP methyl ester carboxylesterase
MRRGNARRRAVVVALAMSAPVLAVPGPPVAARRPPAVVVPELRWDSCGDDFPAAQCAVATVPLDYDDPHAGTTELALARIPASDQAHRIGSVFVNPGGPGGSGVGLALGGFGDFLAANLGGRFDVVGFDPRGVGASDPLHCFDSEQQLGDFFAQLPAIFPYQRDQYRPYYDLYTAFGAECRDGEQRIAAHMSTADVARDLDLLRRAVGDDRLTYLGFSYGTYLGNTYANLFPGNVRALVIDGVLDPTLWSSGWQVRSDRVATQAELDDFLRLCDEAGPACAFSAPGGSAARWQALLDAIRQHPLVLPDGTVYGYDLLLGDVTSAMYAPEVWGGPEGAGALLDLIADAVLGAQDTGSQAAAARAALIARLTPTRPEADYDNGLDAYYGNQCADTQYPSTFGGFLAIDRYAAAGSPFGPFWWWQNAGCTNWPVNRDRYIGPWTARTSAPVLIVGNAFDGITALTGAQASARLLRGSRLLTYAGWGHTAYGRSQCVTDHVDAYLLDGSLPPKGTVCPANPNPFLTATLRASTVEHPLVGLPTLLPARS